MKRVFRIPVHGWRGAFDAVHRRLFLEPLLTPAIIASVARILTMRVGRAFLESFNRCPFYAVITMIGDSCDALETQKLDRVGARSKDRMYSAVEETNCREPRVSNAIID